MTQLDQPLTVTRQASMAVENLTLDFSVSPPTVGASGVALLQWQTTGATSCVLDPGAETLASSGSRYVVVPKTTLFTLTARNATDIRQEQRTIEVDPAILPGGGGSTTATFRSAPRQLHQHADGGRTAHAGATLLTYSILAGPNPLQAGAPGTLTLIVSNPTRDVVTCERIVVVLPIGTNAKDLTPDGAGIESARPRGWNVRNDNGILTCRPETPEAARIAGAGLSFTFGSFAVNAEIGTCRIDIDEKASTDDDPTAERTASIRLPKFPAQFSVSDLRAEPLHVASGGSTTLLWNGTAAPHATWTVTYPPNDEGAPITRTVGPTGPYTADDLTRTGAVAFTLTVSILVPGQDVPLVVQRQTSVTVATLGLSFSVQPTSVGVNGLALLQWEALNASKCVLDPGGETVPARGRRYVVVPQSMNFTITASGGGRMRQEQKRIEVDPAIVPNVSGHTIAGSNGRDGTPVIRPGLILGPGRGGDGGDARLTDNLPPLETSSRPLRVIPITLTGGDGGRGGQGVNDTTIYPREAGGPGGDGGRGGDVTLATTFDASVGAPAQFIVTLKPGKGGDGGKGGSGFPAGPAGSRGRNGIVTITPK